MTSSFYSRLMALCMELGGSLSSLLSYLFIIFFYYLYQALESSSTWIIAFRDEEEKATWLKELIIATYQASVWHKILLFSSFFIFLFSLLINFCA